MSLNHPPSCLSIIDLSDQAEEDNLKEDKLKEENPCGATEDSKQKEDSKEDDSTKYIQLKRKDIPKYRLKLLSQQNFTCQICQVKIPQSGQGSALDHQHRRRKSDPIGLNGGGLIRGVLCRGCNIIEGKVWNNAHRFGKQDNIPQLLRNMAVYLEQKNYPWIHPSEAPKEPKVSKRQYNKLRKTIKRKQLRSPPVLSKRQKLTKDLDRLFKIHEISPFN
jgi:5-methylcytosine-specific restriction endonuclease McrA